MGIFKIKLMKGSSLLLFLAGGVAFLLLTNSLSFPGQRIQEEVQEEYLQKVIKLHYEQGKIYYQEKDYHKAKKEFAEILKFDPRHRAAIKYTELCNKKIEKAKKRQKKKNGFENLVAKAMKAKKEREKKARDQERAILRAERKEDGLKREENLRKKKEVKLKKKEEARLEAQEKRNARDQKQVKLRAERREDRLKVSEEPSKERRAQSEVLIREEEGVGEELPLPTLGERINEEKKKRKEKEDELLLLAEQRLRVLQESVNVFLEEKITKKEVKNYFQNGEKYFRQQRYKEAREEFEKVLAVNPADKKAIRYVRKINKSEFRKYFQTGKKYFEQKRYIQAREEFEKALAIYPADKKAARYLRRTNKLELKLE